MVPGVTRVRFSFEHSSRAASADSGALDAASLATALADSEGAAALDDVVVALGSCAQPASNAPAAARARAGSRTRRLDSPDMNDDLLRAVDVRIGGAILSETWLTQRAASCPGRLLA
jgi:hypothetical protein